MTTRAAPKPNPHIGADFDEFLREEQVYDEAQAVAVKRVLAFELEQGMRKAQLTKTAMARRMGQLGRSLIGCSILTIPRRRFRRWSRQPEPSASA